MSARSSADFLNPTEQNHYPEEWLPPLEPLFNDFDYITSSRPQGRKRRELVIDYADWLRDKFTPDEYAGDREYSKVQITSRVYLDSVSLIARHANYHGDCMQKGRRAPETLQDLIDFLAVKRDMKTNLASYARLNQNSSNDVVFNNILSIMNYARKTIYNDEFTTDKGIIDNRLTLIGMLAENKVLEALQYDKWPLAKHATPEQDSNGADVIIPVGTNPRHAVALQVKSSKAPEGMLHILPHQRLHTIVVPMNLQTQDPFRLPPDSSYQLNQFIYKAPRVRLPEAA